MSTELYGLIACGGKSSRMGVDKCLLQYHDVPQWQYIYRLLEFCCVKVFVSCNETQVLIFPDHITKVVDDVEYAGIGPMAGVISVFKLMPEETFLLIGCDYPFVRSEDLQLLCDARNEHELAVAMMNESNVYEPLLALYKPGSFEILKHNQVEKKYSLRCFLEEVAAFKVSPSSKTSFLSVDTFEEYVSAKQAINH